MITICPIVFKFSEVHIEEIPSDLKKLYEFVIESLLNIKEYNWHPRINNQLTITRTTSQNIPVHASEIFEKTLFDNKILTKEKYLINDHFIILSLTSIDREQQAFYIGNVLKNILSNHRTWKICSFLFVETLPNEKDLLYKHYLKLVQDGKLVIIDRIGNIHCSFNLNLNKIKFLELSRFQFDGTLDLLKQKLIKHPGHFRIKENRKICTSFFYDGRYCDITIRNLVVNFLFEEIEFCKKINYIFYDADYSPWLQNSLSALEGDLKKDFKNEFPSLNSIISIKFIDDIKNKIHNANIIMIFDLINTGNSAKFCYSKLRKYNIKNESIKFLSILNNLEFKDSDRKRIIKYNEEHLIIDYFVDIEIEETDSNHCVFCKNEFKHDDPNKHEILLLRSHEFWNFSKFFGFIPEPYKPISRDKIKLVPNLNAWMSEFSAYFVYKIDTIIRQIDDVNPNRICIIHPNEIETKEKITKKFGFLSMTVANNLKRFCKYNTIGIPRIIIDDIKNQSLKLNELKSKCKNDNWFNSLDELTDEYKIILIDDFIFSSTTSEAINHLLGYFEKVIDRVITIIDFDPNNKKRQPPSLSNKTIPLYQFTYPQ